MAGTDGISRKEYLKRYESNAEEENKKKNKKKGKKRKQRPDAPSGVLVVDEDPVWRKTVVVEEEDEGSADEDKPVVDEDIEVLRMRRLELIKARRLQNPIAEDGSGWVTLSPKRNSPPSPESGGEHLDLSPPRQRRVRRHNSSPETNRSDSPDISPPRRRRRSSPDQAADLSPPRKSSRDVRKEGASDLSPPRSRRPLTGDGGPPGIADQDISPPRKNGKQSATLARPKTGLISGREMRDDILRTRKEDLLRFEQMDPSVSGKGAKAVYRDKKGNRISEEEYFKLNQKVEEKPKEIKIEWGKGLAQKREAESKLLELELEKEKPFARTRDDADLDTMLKERERWGDPMAHLVKKKHSEVVLPDLGDNEKMKESGFIIPQDIPSHSWIKRGLEAAPNRYGIRPGRHWDGVDRSTGFEKKMFKMKNEKQATEREAYLWSVSDM